MSSGPPLAPENQFGIVECRLCQEVTNPNGISTLFHRVSFNMGGDRYCSHRYGDGSRAYHYWNQDGMVYTRRSDGSAVRVDVDGSIQTYPPDPSRVPSPQIYAPNVPQIHITNVAQWFTHPTFAITHDLSVSDVEESDDEEEPDLHAEQHDTFSEL